MTLAEEMRRLRQAVLERRLEEAGGNISKAARAAGINRTHFYAVMRRTGIKRPAPVHGNEQWRGLQ
jgi:transcriptional regulator of acetoin/glycerol metabolism